MCATELNLGRCCGVTFAGIKPASMFSLSDDELEMLPYYEQKFAVKGFVFVKMKKLAGRTLYFVYSKKHLSRVLFDDDNRLFLEEMGMVYTTVEDAVEALKERMAHEDFPHEVGIYLGYPLVDVIGFMNSPESGIYMGGCWKVYGNVDESAKQFERMHRLTERICERMCNGHSLTSIFNV